MFTDYCFTFYFSLIYNIIQFSQVQLTVRALLPAQQLRFFYLIRLLLLQHR